MYLLMDSHIPAEIFWQREHHKSNTNKRIKRNRWTGHKINRIHFYQTDFFWHGDEVQKQTVWLNLLLQIFSLLFIIFHAGLSVSMYHFPSLQSLEGDELLKGTSPINELLNKTWCIQCKTWTRHAYIAPLSGKSRAFKWLVEWILPFAYCLEKLDFFFFVLLKVK